MTNFDNQSKRDPDLTVDGFTEEEIEKMLFDFDSIVEARCTECGTPRNVEPDAEGYDCFECDAKKSVTSPLVKLGLI